MTALQTIDVDDLASVIGGDFSLGGLGSSFLSGFLSSGAQSVQANQGVEGFFTNALKGGVSGLANNFIGQLFSGFKMSSSPSSSSTSSSSSSSGPTGQMSPQ